MSKGLNEDEVAFKLITMKASHLTGFVAQGVSLNRRYSTDITSRSEHESDYDPGKAEKGISVEYAEGKQLILQVPLSLHMHEIGLRAKQIGALQIQLEQTEKKLWIPTVRAAINRLEDRHGEYADLDYASIHKEISYTMREP